MHSYYVAMRLSSSDRKNLFEGNKRLLGHVMAAAAAGMVLLAAPAPPARADGPVMYEVISKYIGSVNVDFTDGSGRTSMQGVALPWRQNVQVSDPYSVDTTLHVTWQGAQRYKWVTVRLYTRGSLLCEGTFDTGDGSCTARGLYGGRIPLFLPPTSPPGAPG